VLFDYIFLPLIRCVGWFVGRSVDWLIGWLLDKGKGNPRTGHEGPEGE